MWATACHMLSGRHKISSIRQLSSPGAVFCLVCFAVAWMFAAVVGEYSYLFVGLASHWTVFFICFHLVYG